MVKADILKKARQFEVKGNYSAAIEEYKKVIKENPNDASIYNMIGDLYAKLGDSDEALKNYAEAARIYESQELYEYAIAILKKAKRIVPDDRYIYFKLADLYLKLDMVRESQEIIREYIDKLSKGEIAVGTEQLYHDIDYILRNFAKDEQMLTQMAQIAENRLKDERDYYEKIIISIAEKFEQLGKREEAYKYYSKIPKDSPFYNKIKVKLAISSTVDKETLNEAIKELKQRVVDSRATITDYKQLIALLEKKGDFEEASKYYTDLAGKYLRSGDFDLAWKNLVLALERDPKNSHALELMAQIIREHPEFQSEKYAGYLLDLGKRYLDLGRLDEAIRYLKMAADTGYDRDSILEFIKQLEECRSLLNIKFKGLPLIKRMKNFHKVDDLTGFISPCKFFSIANEEMVKALRKNEIITFAILDISDFKSFSQSYGEEIARNVLITVANEIKNKFSDEIKKGAVQITRFYDDIFLMMFRGPCFKLKKTLEELIEMVEKKESLLGDYYELRFHAGLVEFPEEATDFKDVIKKLEFILTEISLKSSGREVFSRVRCLSNLSKEESKYRIPEFVDREEELNKLVEIYENVSGKGIEKLVFLRGPVGIGKTTLFEEFLKRLREDRNTWIFKTSLSANFSKSSASAISGLIREFIENPTNFELVNSLNEVPPVIAETIPKLARGTKTKEKLNEEERKLKLINWFEKLVEMLVETGTMVIAIDDLEYIDDLSYSVLLHVFANYKWARIFFIGTYSNESLAEKEKVESAFDYFEKSNLLEVIDLRPFSKEKVREYIEEFMLTANVPEELIDFVVKETSGIPLFIKELLKSLIDNGELIKENGILRWEGRGEVKFTPELEQVFERKLRKISDDILYILGVASTLGAIFSVRDVVKVISRNNAMKVEGGNLEIFVRKNLELAAQNGFIRVYRVYNNRDILYQFLNESVKSFVQKKLNERQTEEALRRIYEASASVLEERMLYGEKDLLPDVAINYMKAGVYDKALYYLISSGQWAEVNGSVKDALNFYNLAIEAYNRLKEEGTGPHSLHKSIYIRILENRARLLMMLSKFEEATKNVNEVLSSEIKGFYRPKYINLLGEIKYRSGRLKEAESVFEKAIAEARKVGNRLEEGKAHLFRAKISIDKGILPIAAEEIKLATKLLKDAHAYDELIEVYLITGIFYLQLANLDKAEKFFTEGYKVAKSRGKIRQKILSMMYGARIKRYKGELDLSALMLSQALEEAKKLFDPGLLGQVLKEYALNFLFKGDMKNSIVKLESAQSHLSSAPYSLHFIDVNLYMALIYILSGSYSKAFKTVSRIQQYLVKCESLPVKLRAYSIKALLDLIFLNPFESLTIIEKYLLKAYEKSYIAREPAPFIFQIVATILYDLENYPYSKKVLDIASRFTEAFPICNCIKNLSEGMVKLLLKESEDVDDKEIYLSFKSFIQSLAFPRIFYLEYIAFLSDQHGDPEKCEKNFRTLISFCKSNGYFFYAERALISLGKCMIKRKKYDIALSAFEEVISLLKVSNSLFFEAVSYYYMLEIYFSKGENEKIYTIFDKFNGFVEILEEKSEKFENTEQFFEKAPLLKKMIELRDKITGA